MNITNTVKNSDKMSEVANLNKCFVYFELKAIFE